MTREFVEEFAFLLDSYSDGIEVGFGHKSESTFSNFFRCRTMQPVCSPTWPVTALRRGLFVNRRGRGHDEEAYDVNIEMD